MNVNVLVSSAVLPTPLDLQSPPTDVQPSVNILPVNAMTQSSEVIPTDTVSSFGTQQQITPEEIRPASLLNQDQVNPSF